MNWSAVLQFIFTDAPTQGLIFAIVALGVFLSFKILNVADMSVDSLFPFAGIVSLSLINAGVPAFISLLIAVALGMIVGYINAALHVYLKINPLLASIIVMIALYTPNVIISKGNVTLLEGKNSIFMEVNSLFNNMIASKLVLLVLFVLVFFVAVYWFFGTELGLSIRASGKNDSMAKANGINTKKTYILGMILSDGLVSLAGALYGQMSKHFSADGGRGTIVIGLAIIFLGEVIFSSKSFKLSLLSLAIGGLIYWLIIDIIIEIPSFNTNYLNLTKAVFMTLVISIYELKKKLATHNNEENPTFMERLKRKIRA
ncbi:MAG: ABC transporter permease [Bacilli bacterium]